MATFGKTTDGASSTTINDADGDNYWVSSHSPASTGTVTSLTHRFSVTAGSVNWRGVIYSDVAGVPTTLLAVTDDGNVTGTTEAERTANFTGANQITVTAGTSYWIGIHWESPAGGNMTLSRDATASLRRTGSGDTWSDGSPSSFGSPTTLSGPIDCYVTYTLSGVPSLPLLGVGI